MAACVCGTALCSGLLRDLHSMGAQDFSSAGVQQHPAPAATLYPPQPPPQPPTPHPDYPAAPQPAAGVYPYPYPVHGTAQYGYLYPSSVPSTGGQPCCPHPVQVCVRACARAHACACACVRVYERMHASVHACVRTAARACLWLPVALSAMCLGLLHALCFCRSPLQASPCRVCVCAHGKHGKRHKGTFAPGPAGCGSCGLPLLSAPILDPPLPFSAVCAACSRATWFQAGR